MAQTVDLLIDGAVLLNIGVSAWYIRLRLVVIVVTDEILHRVVRKKLLELCTKLRSQRFVVRQHQRGAVEVRNDVCHRKRFAAACHTQERLTFIALQQPVRQLCDGLGLVARGLVRRLENKSVLVFFFHFHPSKYNAAAGKTSFSRESSQRFYYTNFGRKLQSYTLLFSLVRHPLFWLFCPARAGHTRPAPCLSKRRSMLARTCYPPNSRPTSRAPFATRAQDARPAAVGSANAAAVHFQLCDSLRMVRHVVEHGQCISENSIVHTAVTHVQPLLYQQRMQRRKIVHLHQTAC